MQRFSQLLVALCLFGGATASIEDVDGESLDDKTWATIFTEAVGDANGVEFDNSDERTLNFPSAPSCTNSGDYWVKLEYNGGRETTFKVPAGKDIFSQTEGDFQIDQVTSTMAEIGWTATFCHACTKDGYRHGDTCWAVVPSGDNNRQCGCCSGGWAGNGLYYGGYKNQDPPCGSQGGGFVGQKTNGQPKGNLGSVGLTLSVSCASPSAQPDTGACFHGNGTVLLQSGASKLFSELVIGDFIKTYDAEGKFSFSPIKTLPHANNNEPAAFLALKTETGKKVDMTSDHYIPKCDLTVVTAGELVVGDCLLTADGKETLMEISWTKKYGVYTAVTEQKFVVVDGVVASAFSKDSHPEERELDYKKYSMELERMKSSKLAYLSRKATNLKG